MISDFREGGRFSKIGESLCKKDFSIGGKSEIGGRGGQKRPQKIGYHIWTAPKPVLKKILLNQADWMCLLANTDTTGERKVHNRMSLIVVPMDTKGVIKAKKIEK